LGNDDKLVFNLDFLCFQTGTTSMRIINKRTTLRFSREDSQKDGTIYKKKGDNEHQILISIIAQMGNGLHYIIKSANNRVGIIYPVSILLLSTRLLI
jgi:hypothetical protein